MAEAANLEGDGGRGSDANSLILTATSSFSSPLSSSDLETESTISFLSERSTTLGSLIGINVGVSAMTGDAHSSLPRSSRVNHVNCRAGRTALSSVGSMTSGHGISFSHVSRIRDVTKFWNLLPCRTCIYANHKGICKGFCCAHESDTGIVSSATGPLSSSLGHFLIAERDVDRDVDRWRDEAKVYINIMFEDSHGVEEAAVNPLFDLDSTPAIVGTSGRMFSRDPRETQTPPQLCRRSQSISREAGVMPSLSAHDENFMMRVVTVGGTTSVSHHAETTSLAIKGQKMACKNVCELGCVSYVWTRCRF